MAGLGADVVTETFSCGSASDAGGCFCKAGGGSGAGVATNGGVGKGVDTAGNAGAAGSTGGADRAARCGGTRIVSSSRATPNNMASSMAGLANGRRFWLASLLSQSDSKPMLTDKTIRPSPRDSSNRC